MSYARFGADGSDVYVFFNTGGYFECCACRLAKPDLMTMVAEEMAVHLQEHRKAGHCVPQSCIERILEHAFECEKCGCNVPEEVTGGWRCSGCGWQHREPEPVEY